MMQILGVGGSWGGRVGVWREITKGLPFEMNVKSRKNLF